MHWFDGGEAPRVACGVVRHRLTDGTRVVVRNGGLLWKEDWKEKNGRV
jgi:hypothetical protein